MPIRPWSLILTASLQLAALRGCTALEDWQSQAQAVPPSSQPCERWGDGRGLSPAQAIALRNLSWPQSYAAVIDRLGYPDCRTETVDIYLLPSGGTARIHYSGLTAISTNLQDP